jgi:ubiquinone/menaquinone biosynthesis C-methylase UbiE
MAFRQGIFFSGQNRGNGNLMSNPKTPPTRSVMARFMRLFFRLLYHPFAWTYDLVAASVSMGRWKQWVLSSADLLEGQRVLELGFGPGHLQVHLHAAGYQAVGLDESFQMARQASRRLLRRSRPPRLVRGLAQNLPYPARSFDNVIATFPTPYIYDPESLAEIARVLEPGGRLIILMGARITGKSLADRLLAGLFRVTRQTPTGDSDHRQQLTVFTDAGFSTELLYRDLTDRVGRPSSRLMYILARSEFEHRERANVVNL